MKHSSDTDSVEQLELLAHKLGVEIDDACAERMLAHLALLLEANERVNLTAIRAFPDALRLHAADSAAILPHVAQAPAGRLADLGSGGGFPGIPIAICTNRSVTLVESIKKKAAFLEAAAHELGLDDSVEVHAVRAEEEAAKNPGSYSVVVARALSSLPSLVELASPLLAKQGHLIAMKGRLESDELERAERAAALVGMRQVRVSRYELPAGGESRSIVVYERVGRAGIKLPRNPGLAQKKPLA